MTDWTGGYVADIGYTYGYYSELNPLRVRQAFLNARLAFPETGVACELGFGQGLSANVHAAASVTKWYGTDFNPSQAGFAQQLARSFADGPQMFDEAFAEFCQRPDLPDFDFICLHGIWSWISNENRGLIVDFVRRKLKVGGVLYISYNTEPGWGAMVPMRALLTQHADVMSAPGAGTASKVDAALEFAKRLFATEPLFAKANPHVRSRVMQIAEQNRNYVAHEYFNRDWLPMSFADIAEALEPAKVSFACSATFSEHVEALHLSPEQQALLNEIADPIFRQSVRDFMVNQQFRRDYWVKGPRTLNAVEFSEALRAQRVIMCIPMSKVELKIRGALGEIGLVEAIYRPILNYLADYQIRSFGEIEQALHAQGISLLKIQQACLLLGEKGVVRPVQDDAVIRSARPRAEQLNLHLMQLARGQVEVSYLASPVLGGGVAVHRFQQLFLLARAAGKQSVGEWAAYVWQVLKSQQQTLVKDNVRLETDEAALAELTAQATEFQSERMPILQALGVI